ncbi:MBOAT family O-acyltransferase [Marixanthomonas spongiae]|uniref:Membrane-bound O-acyltransferase family protein n=1 Tax=Marixanthomonas spongiae TaxID=2174845 RepID=A0A2U0HTZ1_9FLAO|nr:MBOAT family O-acyltransferase [Marixanthomonas spongiae]PVW12326.1 membrane-bound O-acyltransferase family protein [Marixanthomonas spongiae]
MLFNSFSFGLFLPIVLLLYWAAGYKRIKAQNTILLIASYVFYGLWDWRFLFLIFASSIIDYAAGRAIASTAKKSKKQLYLLVSIIWNLGVLFIFKYYNFFAEGFANLFHLGTQGYTYNTLDIILPVGLSFYTFQTMSYSIDVYRSRIQPTHNLLNFLCFVSFFPQLVAGPIERARSLLPQFSKQRGFNRPVVVDGLRQILWGLFMKMVVADNVALAVNTIYAEPDSYGSLSLLYASVLFFFQIYCDFAGYSNIAIGTAKLFGFQLSKNFNIPYLSRSVAEFWQRWHITLTKWFTDYVYAPLIRNWKRSYISRTIALFITMTLIGLWHGANWSFVFFGVFQAIAISVERIPVKAKGKLYNINYFLNRMPLPITVIYSFTLIMASCIFFRAETFGMAVNIINRVITFIPSKPFSLEIGLRVLFVPLLIFMEVTTRNKNHPFEFLEKKYNRPVRWLLYYIFVFFIIRYAGPKEEFIYFQF